LVAPRYEAGATIEALATELGVGYGTVRTALIGAGGRWRSIPRLNDPGFSGVFL
jgi:hypothetical protein